MNIVVQTGKTLLLAAGICLLAACVGGSNARPDAGAAPAPTLNIASTVPAGEQGRD
jgi:hypothetical protein